jgi:hypothetical protein
MGYLSNNYRSRMYRCYVVRCPKTITFSWAVIKGFLEEVTVRKISFYSTQVPEPLFTHCNRSQVEQQYGGLQNNLLKSYWLAPLKMLGHP